jgi:hypothetical protein
MTASPMPEDYKNLLTEIKQRIRSAQFDLTRIKPLLREAGDMLTFMGSQYRLEINGEDYFIDLLFYHRGLKSLVAIELKIGKLIPEHVGQMQFYLAALEAQTELPDENPPIGIILCKSKNQTTVEYALKNSNQPIGVGSYSMTSTPPQSIKDQLPAPEQIAKLLEGFEWCDRFTQQETQHHSCINNVGFHCVAPKLRNRQGNHLILHQRLPKSAAIRQHNRHLQRRIRLHLQISPGNAEF